MVRDPSPFGYIIYEKQTPIGADDNSKDLASKYFCVSNNKTEQCRNKPLNALIEPQGYTGLSQGKWITDPLTETIPPFIVPQTGYYCIKLVNPSADLYHLRIEFENPFGLLRAELYPLLQLSVVLAISYALVLILWFIASYKYRQVILPVQHAIAFVLGLNLLEMASNHLYYSYTNTNGLPSFPLLLAVTSVGAFRTTASMFLVLIVSLGYGTVRYYTRC